MNKNGHRRHDLPDTVHAVDAGNAAEGGARDREQAAAAVDKKFVSADVRSILEYTQLTTVKSRKRRQRARDGVRESIRNGRRRNRVVSDGCGRTRSASGSCGGRRGTETRTRARRRCVDFLSWCSSSRARTRTSDRMRLMSSGRSSKMSATWTSSTKTSPR